MNVQGSTDVVLRENIFDNQTLRIDYFVRISEPQNASVGLSVDNALVRVAELRRLENDEEVQGSSRGRSQD